MEFIIVQGRNRSDQESIELITRELSKRKINYQIKNYIDCLSENLSNRFVISVGGPAVNDISARIKDIYQEGIDKSKYGAIHYNDFYGSQYGVKANNYKLGGCIAFWGEEAPDTLRCTEYFLRDGSILDDILSNYENWTKQIDLNYRNEKYLAKLRGVNLGGWLVLEKWMVPSLFENLKATDETSFCVELGKNAENKLIKHWSSFITESDFKWISDIGLNAVRIPYGFWIFGPPYPYHPKFGSNREPFVKGGIEYLDRAFEWAEKYNLYILLDLHAAPGCQNGFDNGGMLDVIDWHRNQERIDFTLDVLERIAKRYGKRKSLIGIEALNEPHWSAIPIEILKEFTVKAYERVRKHTNKYEVAFVFNDLRDGYEHYKNFLTEPKYSNVVYDFHHYQCFKEIHTKLNYKGHLSYVINELDRQIDDMRNNLSLKIYIGEWSLGLNKRVVSIFDKTNVQDPLSVFEDFSKNNAYRAYGAAQLLVYEKCNGWFFWSYKTENVPEWNFRECVNRGWLPNKFNI